jgi:hypothetical protein
MSNKRKVVDIEPTDQSNIGIAGIRPFYDVNKHGKLVRAGKSFENHQSEASM